jgi:hypothetical protein
MLHYVQHDSALFSMTETKKPALVKPERAFVLRARGEIRTPTPEGTTPSRWRVYQFHHVRKRQLKPGIAAEAGVAEAAKRVQRYNNPTVETTVRTFF